MQKVKVLFTVILLFSLTGIASADTHTVSGTSRSDILSTFNDASSGDTVTFKEGDYYLPDLIVITGKNLKIVGEGTVKIHSTAGADPCLIFSGSAVLKTTASKSVSEGSTTVEISDASKVKSGDLIKIWKNVQWCPLDYPEQLTGEVYKITSVSGNTLTLNEPLLRDYPSGANIEITRPAKITIDNLQILNTDPKGKVEGLRLQYCTDSVIKNCIFKDNGRAAIRIKCCWDTTIENNKIYDSTRPGNGYGVSIYDGSAYITVKNNYIKNCRHCISSGASLEFNSLNREMKSTYNTLIGGSVTDSFTLDSHEMDISNIVTHNIMYVQDRWAAYQDGSLNSVYTDNVIYVEEGRPQSYSGGTYRKRGHVDGGTHIKRNNEIRIWKTTPGGDIIDDYTDNDNDNGKGEGEEDVKVIPPEDNSTDDATTDEDSVIIDDEDVYEENFDDIFDIFKIEFSDTGITEQTEDDIDYELEEETRGRITGAIKIVGFKDVVYIDGVPYIPSEDSMLVKYVAYQTPINIWYNGGTSSFDYNVNKEIKDGVAYANLTVYMTWFTVKENKITGAKKKKYHNSTAVFGDSCPSFQILKREKEAKAYINVYEETKNPFFKIKVPYTNTTQKIDVSYGDKKTTHKLMIGERAKGENGVIYTILNRCDRWEGSIPNMGNELIIYERFDKTKLNIEYSTPYDSFNVDDIEIIYHEKEEQSRNMLILKFLVYLIMAMFAGYEIMKTIIS